MNIILKISPPFVRRLDSYLRTNYPAFWATMFHLNLYTAILMLALFSLLGLLIGIDVKDVPTEKYVNIVFALLFIPATAWLIFMIKQLSLFNIDKVFGKRKNLTEFPVFIIYFITFALPLIIPYSTICILNFRTANLVSDKEFNEDICNYYKGKMYFPTSIYDYSYYPNDTFYLQYESSRKNGNAIPVATNSKSPGDSVQNEEMQNQYRDNAHDLCDSIFYEKGSFSHSRPYLYYNISNNPTSSFRRTRDYSDDSNPALDSAINGFLCHQNIARDERAGMEQILLFCKLLKKYSGTETVDPQTILRDYHNHNYNTSYSDNYLNCSIDEVYRNMQNINYAKYFLSYMYSQYLIVFFFVFVFFIAIIFNIFKNVYWKQFLLGAAIFAILATLLLFFDVLFNYKFKFFITGTMLIVLLCIVFFIRGFKAKQYSVFMNQSTILLNLLFPILPFLLLTYLSTSFDFISWLWYGTDMSHVSAVYDYSYYKFDPEYYRFKMNVIWWTFWAGIILYVVLWNTLLKKLYIKLWALPRPN
jgi:hypothetical protein